MSLIINFVPAFTVFASMKNAFFTRGKSQGKTGLSLQPLLVWKLGFLVSIKATQIQFLGMELITISLHATAHCCLSEIIMILSQSF